MRGLKRQKQTIYWSRVTEELDGIDTIKKYQNPEPHCLSVSATAGTPEELSAGYVPDYDRYITNCRCVLDRLQTQIERIWRTYSE